MNLKKYLFLFLAATALPLTGCGSDDSNDGSNSTPTIELGQETLTFPSEGGSQNVTITVNHEWGAIVSTGVDWVKISPSSNTSATGGTTTSTVTVTANPYTESRTTSITIAAGSARKAITITQEAALTNSFNVPEGYKLVWNDEFDGNELGADWTQEVQSSGWVNNELQNYIKDPSVNEVKDGNLNIHCYKGSDGKVYSGRVYAKVDKGWQYGYFVARIKLPSGKGTWPAFWMMPVTVDWVNEGWPKCGEIDIMEEVGAVPNEVSSSFHALGHNHTNNTQITHAMTIDKAEGEYHTYALEWTPTKLTTYVDDKVQLSYDNPGTGVTDWPYDKPFYVILNLAWGGDWGGFKGINENALPVTMSVDYVRVFQKK